MVEVLVDEVLGAGLVGAGGGVGALHEPALMVTTTRLAWRSAVTRRCAAPAGETIDPPVADTQ